MTRETFERILREKDILWNDLVELEVFNPNYKRIIPEAIENYKNRNIDI